MTGKLLTRVLHDETLNVLDCKFIDTIQIFKREMIMPTSALFQWNIMLHKHIYHSQYCQNNRSEMVHKYVFLIWLYLVTAFTFKLCREWHFNVEVISRFQYCFAQMILMTMCEERVSGQWSKSSYLFKLNFVN